MGLYTAKKYNFKSFDCDEVFEFDIAFANKEFFQNTQGQINKALQIRKWRDWERLDLRDNSAATLEKRERTKARLIKTDPCLFAGDQGKAIARSKICKPSYVLEATIPWDEIKGDRRDHDLRAVVVFWVFQKDHTEPAGPTALTFYNNYLDKEAQFSHFVHDGSSTSKGNDYAVGLKGKGFILAMSFLAQECEQFKQDCENSAQKEGCPVNDICKTILGLSHKPIGVGFNVGSRFCKGAYNKAKPRMLQMKKEDLRALSLAEFQAESKQ